MSAPLISVITPTFNPGLKLEETVRSVFAAANFADIEVECLVQDGASSDGTSALMAVLMDEFGSKLLFESERDCGVFDAMNKGIAKSRGIYLYFLGAGDRVRPDGFSQLARALPSHRRGIVYGKAHLMEFGLDYGAPFTKFHIARGNLSHQAIFYGREVFDLLGNYEVKYPISADHAFNIKCFGDPRIEKLWIDSVIADFEAGGLSSTSRDELLHRDRPRLVRRHLGTPIYLMWRLNQLSPRWLIGLIGKMRRAVFKPK